MHKIVVKHTSIVINDYNMGDCLKLERLFTLYDKTTHSTYTKAIEYIADKKQLIIPRGVDVQYIEQLFQTPAYLDTVCDQFDYIDPIKVKYAPRDDVQKEALAFMLGEREYSFNKGKSQLSLNLPTGKGKTYCAITVTSLTRIRSIMITSLIKWIEQWKEDILDYTNIKEDEIFMIVGAANINKLLKSDMSKYKFILASHDTIAAYGSRYGWDKVTELFKHMRVGYKFIDEAHLNFDNICRIDYYTNTYKTFYITATPNRSDIQENVIYRYYFKNIPSINLFDPSTDPHTDYIALIYNSRPSVFEVSQCANAYGFDKNRYASYIINKENFYKILTIVIQMALKNNGKNLFYIATIEAINIIYDWIIYNYPELEGNVGVFHSKIDKEIKSAQLEKKIILSTTKSLGAAMDIKGLKMTVVLAEPFRTKVNAVQTLGRTRDKDTLYIDVVDRGFKSIVSYYKDKLPLFNNFAKTVSVIELIQNTLDMKYNEIINSRMMLRRVPPPIQYTQPMNKPIEIFKEIKKDEVIEIFKIIDNDK